MPTISHEPCRIEGRMKKKKKKKKRKETTTQQI
jgi:hypothetical protein